MKGFWHISTFLTNAPLKNPQPTHCFVWLNLSCFDTFTFSGEIFKQINGVAMGTKMGPNYVCWLCRRTNFQSIRRSQTRIFWPLHRWLSWGHILHQKRIGTIYRFCQLFPSGPQIHMGNLWNLSHFSRYQHFCPRQHFGNQCPLQTHRFLQITHLPTHLMSKTQFRTPNFSGSVDSAAKIQTLTPNAMKCLISFPNVAILTASYLKHSIVSKTSTENLLQNHQPQTMKNEFLPHSLSILTI